jgi:23S rRNA (cytidine1920-2'-O)/16S rRNA (cytidine1409-2'-O)-methyltransferase
MSRKVRNSAEPPVGASKRAVAKLRADVLLVERNLASSRSQAQSLLLSGRVYSGEQRVEKAGSLLAEDAPLELRGGERYVSRGGIKLEGALAALGVDVTGLDCADIGASTGGFTDCLLQHGARRVHAVDVGQGLLDARLRSDPRVHVLEKTNARHLTVAELGEAVDLVVVDASFISLGKLLDALRGLLKDDGRLLALVKPQFEAGREAAAKGKGVIRDPEVRKKAIEDAVRDVAQAGFTVENGCDSSLPGPKGNVEYFVLARKAQKTSTQTS